MDAGLVSEPPNKSQWEIGVGQSVEISIEESGPTKSADSDDLANPNPSNEHVGVNDECLYIDIGPEHSAPPPIPTSQSNPNILRDDGVGDDVVQRLTAASYNLDIDIITSSPDGIAEVCAKGSSSSFRFVVDLTRRTCSCRVWQGSGIPCKHAIAYITSIPGAKLEDYVDECYSVEKFNIAYEGSVPSLPDKSQWPKPTHGFFMYPPLLKSTAGRSKNRHKSALEGGSSRKKRQHECPICHQLGHHWYTCKNGNPDDMAAYEAERGPPKKRLKKASSSNTETSIVVATPPSGMVFPHNEAVANVAQKPKRVKKAGKKKGPPPPTSSSRKSATGSNDPFPLQIEHHPVVPEPSASVPESSAASPQIVVTPRKRHAVMKKYTPRRDPVGEANPSSPASNTRSKKKLDLE